MASAPGSVRLSATAAWERTGSTSSDTRPLGEPHPFYCVESVSQIPISLYLWLIERRGRACGGACLVTFLRAV
jgi:hypothetical protein